MPNILTQSVQSLHLKLLGSDGSKSQGTGFVVWSPIGPVLLTNWHVVTGLDSQTEKPLVSGNYPPVEMVITHNQFGRLGSWVERREPLFEAGEKLWRGYRLPSGRADVVALPLTQLDDVQLYPRTLGQDDPRIQCGPSDSLSVIGFPFDLRVGGSLAIWMNGFVASEPDIDYLNLPIFLVDCRTRSGQSGSPVIAYRSGGSVGMEGGDVNVYTGSVSRFLGIYSGRIHKDSDLGMVWKAEMLRDFVASLT